jgi:hypothetical protein
VFENSLTKVWYKGVDYWFDFSWSLVEEETVNSFELISLLAVSLPRCRDHQHQVALNRENTLLASADASGNIPADKLVGKKRLLNGWVEVMIRSRLEPIVSTLPLKREPREPSSDREGESLAEEDGFVMVAEVKVN